MGKNILRSELRLTYFVGTTMALATIGSAGYIGYKAVEKHFTPTEQVENVIGNENPEQFIEFQGRRHYSEIDGKPVESYINK